MNLPKNICILVLAYNVENYIEKVINELLDLELQIFVIDDKSKDNTKIYYKVLTINLIKILK